MNIDAFNLVEVYKGQIMQVYTFPYTNEGRELAIKTWKNVLVRLGLSPDNNSGNKDFPCYEDEKIGYTLEVMPSMPSMPSNSSSCLNI